MSVAEHSALSDVYPESGFVAVMVVSWPDILFPLQVQVLDDELFLHEPKERSPKIVIATKGMILFIRLKF